MRNCSFAISLPLNNGKILIPEKLNRIWFWDDYLEITKDNGAIGLFDYQLNMILPFDYDKIYICGRKYWNDKDYFLVKQNGKYGYVDENNNILFPIQYKDGFKAVNNRALVINDGQYEMLCFNESDNFSDVFPSSYSQIVSYSVRQNSYKLKSKETGLWGIMVGNKIVAKCQFDHIYDLTGGYSKYFAMYKEKGKYGFLSEKGGIITFPDYDEVKPYKSGSKFLYGKQNGNWFKLHLNGSVAEIIAEDLTYKISNLSRPDDGRYYVDIYKDSELYIEGISIGVNYDDGVASISPGILEKRRFPVASYNIEMGTLYRKGKNHNGVASLKEAIILTLKLYFENMD